MKEEKARQNLRAQKARFQDYLRRCGMKAGCEYILETDEDGFVYWEMKALQRYVELKGTPEDMNELLQAMEAADLGLDYSLVDDWGNCAWEPEFVSAFATAALAKFSELAP